MGKSLEALAKESSYALVLGIGGGGDVVGALPTSRYLRWLGIRTLVGGLTWERYVNDPEPGPRRMEEIIGIKRLSATVGLANAERERPRASASPSRLLPRCLRRRRCSWISTKGCRG